MDYQEISLGRLQVREENPIRDGLPSTTTGARI